MEIVNDVARERFSTSLNENSNERSRATLRLEKPDDPSLYETSNTAEKTSTTCGVTSLLPCFYQTVDNVKIRNER